MTIDTHLADGLGPVTIGCLADGEAPELLPDLTAQRLLAQIVQIQLVDDPRIWKPSFAWWSSLSRLSARDTIRTP